MTSTDTVQHKGSKGYTHATGQAVSRFSLLIIGQSGPYWTSSGCCSGSKNAQSSLISHLIFLLPLSSALPKTAREQFNVKSQLKTVLIHRTASSWEWFITLNHSIRLTSLSLACLSRLQARQQPVGVHSGMQNVFFNLLHGITRTSTRPQRSITPASKLL